MRKLRYIGRYDIEDRTLGKGNFAVVELATHTITKTKVAIKVIDRHKIKEEYVKQNLGRESRILSQLRHPNVVRLYETIVSSSLYCLVTEYAGGGDLLSHVRCQRDGRLRESDARPFVRQLVSVLHHLHERGVVHRDLKMENIMLDSRKRNIKIVDFGLSNSFTADQLLLTHCGSPEYAAPELFTAGNGYYGPEVDIWSLGINIYAMVCGKLPFTTPHSANRRHRLLQQLQYGLGPLQEKEMSKLSSECQELLHQCIEPNPELRAPLLDIEVQLWITDGNKLPFYPYQQPRRDRGTRRMIIQKMSTLLNVSENKIESSVHEYRLDEVSAIYNLLMDDHLSCKGYWLVDHTTQGVLKRPNATGNGNGAIKDGVEHEEKRSEEPKTPSTDAELVRVSLRTPTIIGMVRPSQTDERTDRRSMRSADFELRAISNGDEKASKRRPKTTCLAQGSSKGKPMGNATTQNIIVARNNNYSKIHSHLLCGDCKTQRQKFKAREDAQTVVEVPNAGQEDIGTGIKLVEEESNKHSSQNDKRSSPCDRRDQEQENAVQLVTDMTDQCDKEYNECDNVQNDKPDEKGRFNGKTPTTTIAKSTNGTCNLTIEDQYSCEDFTPSLINPNIPESQKEIKVIDMVQYFNSKHGYRVSETPFVFPRGKSAELEQKIRNRVTEVDTDKGPICDDHEQVSWSMAHTPQQVVTYKRCTPFSGPALRKEDETHPPTAIDIKLPRNDEGYQSDSESERGRSVTPQKAKWRPRFYHISRRRSESNSRSPQRTSHEHNCDSSPPPSSRVPIIDRPLFCTPVASFQTTQDLFESKALQVSEEEPRTETDIKHAKKNRMPQRLCWKKNNGTESKYSRKDDEVKTRNRTCSKAKQLMRVNSLHEEYPQVADMRIHSGTLRLKSAMSASSSTKTTRTAVSQPSTATSREKEGSPRHATCKARSNNDTFRMEKYTGYVSPNEEHDGVIDLSNQHMLSVLQEASTTLENRTKLAERRQCQSQLHYYHQTSHRHQPEKSWQKAMHQLRPHHHDSIGFAKRKITDALDSDTGMRRSPVSRPATVRALGVSRRNVTRSAGGGIAKQLGQRVTFEEGSLNPDTGRPPSVLSPEQPVFNMEASRPSTGLQNEKITYRLPRMNNEPCTGDPSQEWSVGYMLERKLSNTLKGGDVIAQMRKTPQAM